MNILLTGASGFIGRHLLEILSQYHTVFANSLPINKDKSDILSSTKSNFLEYDLSSEKPRIHSDIDVIIHCAACTHNEYKIHDFVKGNIDTTRNIVDFALEKKTKLLIYFSAVSVYGHAEGILDEQSQVSCSCPYGLTKLLGEKIIWEAREKLNSIVFRLPVILGQEMSSGWFYDTFVKIRNNNPVNLYNCSSRYNLLHIDDLCRLVNIATESEIQGYNLFLASSNDLLTINEVIEILRLKFSSKSTITKKSMEDHGFTISSEKILHKFNFTPMSAREAIELFLSNK